MPICSNAKFDLSEWEKKSPETASVFDQSTSPTMAAIIRDIENLYLLLSTPTDGQTGSPENAWQDTAEGGTITTTGEGGGTGIPAGYGEITLEVCYNGSAKNISVIGKWL